MKKLTALLLIVFLSGCTLIDSFFYMDEVDFYNTYIDEFNVLAEDLDLVVSDYLYYVPEVVTTEDEIYFYGAEYTRTSNDIETAREVIFDSSMTIADETKEANLEAIAMDYFNAFDEFLEIYQEAADFYRDDLYKEDLEYPVTLEENILAQYDIVLSYQFELSDLIEEYQVEARGELNEDTDNPLEKMGISATLLTDQSSEIIDVMYLWDFEVPADEEVKELYDWLTAKHLEEVAEVDALYDSGYDEVFEAFEEDYLPALDNFEAEVAKFVEDLDEGLVTYENSAEYDGAFVYYDYLIDAHNAFVDLLNVYY